MFPLQANTVTPVIDLQDLSRYREFQLMNLLAVAKQADVEPSEARVIHQRPALIQELEWRLRGSLSSSSRPDPVSEVLFSFYNGELFRMVVNYDRHRTEGLTDEDMIEAISLKYGPAIRPEAKIILFSSVQVYNDSEKVIARWEDRQYLFDLFRTSYQPTFGMIVYSKFLDAPVATLSIWRVNAPRPASNWIRATTGPMNSSRSRCATTTRNESAEVLQRPKIN
jgi:hypothetical protein